MYIRKPFASGWRVSSHSPQPGSVWYYRFTNAKGLLPFGIVPQIREGTIFVLSSVVDVKLMSCIC